MSIKDLILSAIRSVSKNEMKKNKELQKQTQKLLKLVSHIQENEHKGDKNAKP